MKRLYLAWQDQTTRKWLPVGELTQEGKKFCFSYTKGATRSDRFRPFGLMKNMNVVYESKELFPLFTNRLMVKSRPEYNDYLKWLNLSQEDASPLSILSISSGTRKTDPLELFPCPSPNEKNQYEVEFFSRGIRYLPPENQKQINKLQPGDLLFLLRDVQNPFDAKALLMRTDDPMSIAGYCPMYFNHDFNQLLDQNETVSVSVVRVNTNAPSQMRLLCKFQSTWPEGFIPCNQECFEPIPKDISCQ